MGFLSAIFKVFFPSGSRSTKPEKSERDYDLEEWERNKKLLTKAMTETLELTSFSYDTKSKGVSGFLCLGRLFQGQPNEAALCI